MINSVGYNVRPLKEYFFPLLNEHLLTVLQNCTFQAAWDIVPPMELAQDQEVAVAVATLAWVSVVIMAIM